MANTGWALALTFGPKIQINGKLLVKLSSQVVHFLKIVYWIKPTTTESTCLNETITDRLVCSGNAAPQCKGQHRER
jgi:hypothetical protein